MRKPRPESIFLRQLRDRRLATKHRLAALAGIPRPPLATLLNLLHDKTTNPRLAAALARRYELEYARKEISVR